jgi:uncharacterized membrane-anchored protein
MQWKSSLLRTLLAAILTGFVGTTAIAAAPAAVETPEEIVNAALRQSIGAPARADIDDQATERLSDALVMIPREPAEKWLVVANRQVPPDFKGLLLGADGLDALGIIRFVPAGHVDSDAALAWTADDMLASLKDTIERQNADRIARNLQPLEARRWVQPPKYNPRTHQIQWAALILPKSAPIESDGETTYHAIGFGRDGYVELTVVTDVQKAAAIADMAEGFLSGLAFRPGKAYGDVVPTDGRAASGLAGAMGIDALHKATSSANFWSPDTVFPIVGGICAMIGGVSLFFYIQRNLRRESRRS